MFIGRGGSYSNLFVGIDGSIWFILQNKIPLQSRDWNRTCFTIKSLHRLLNIFPVSLGLETRTRNSEHILHHSSRQVSHH